jgi:glucose dehydrogenase
MAKLFRLRILAAALVLFAVSCSKQPPTRHVAGASGNIEGKLIAPAAAEDGQWLMAAKDYANTRYSALDQITTANVSNLRVAFSFSTGATAGHEGAPLVVGDKMYVVTPFPNLLYALDLKNGGQLLWTYDPKAAPSAKGVACCDVVIAGPLIGTVEFTTTPSTAIR